MKEEGCSGVPIYSSAIFFSHPLQRLPSLLHLTSKPSIMKELLSLTSLFLACLSFASAQVIPNGDLETWIDSPGAWSEVPAGWITQNGQLFQSAFKETSACEGEFALKLQPMAGIESIMGAATLEFPTTSIPPQLNFCVKTNIESNDFFTDTCRVIISFFNAGNEFYSEEWVNSVSITDWTEVSITLNQIEPLMDSCHIEVQASYPGIGLGSGSLNTWIAVDDFKFSEVNNVLENSGDLELNIYPNPSSDGLFTVQSSERLSNFILLDILGHVILEETNINQSSFALKTNLSTGMYFLQWNGQTKKVIVD
ncbi:MAG: T9SS type A sorting domain-containing protein [Flavobacteriales bacterium]